MRTRRIYPPDLPRQYFRTELRACPTCAAPLRRYCTLAQRPIITATGPLFVTHVGCRCSNSACPTAACCYRSAAAEALALPGFTFGLDLVVRAGQAHWGDQQTLDQVHHRLLTHRVPWHLTVCRREVLYLGEAYATLLCAAQAPASDPTWPAWLAQVHTNGGLILSLDGIQPDKGNETVYLVRDVLTGRVLAAEQVRESSTATIKRLLAPVVALGLPILGAITAAQESLIAAVAELWPGPPHQLCHFHYLREASRLLYEADRAVKVAVRQVIQPRVRDVRLQLERGAPPTAAVEAAQLAVLAAYAVGVQTAGNSDGTQPLHYAGVAMDTALTAIATSLDTVAQKGGPVAVE